MRTQTLLIVLLALTFGGIAAAGVMLFSNGSQARGVERGAMIIAAVDVPRGETLTPESVIAKDLPKDAVLSGVVTRVEDVVGRSAIAPLFKGEPILDVKLAPKGAGRGLASLIKKGMRAITIPTPNVGAGVAGFIVPGSRVDVHWTSQEHAVRRDDQAGSSVPLLENVEVLAVDDKIDVPTANRTEGTQMKSVTVQLTPEDAGKLTPALSKGIVHLSLRNPSDEGKVPPPPVAAPPVKPDVVVTAPPAPRLIRIFRGTREMVIRLDGQSESLKSAK
jgi:pilus assembly protein CpaB